MEEKSASRPNPSENFQIDLAEALRQQIKFQIRVLKSAIHTLRDLEELPAIPPQPGPQKT